MRRFSWSTLASAAALSAAGLLVLELYRRRRKRLIASQAAGLVEGTITAESPRKDRVSSEVERSEYPPLSEEDKARASAHLKFGNTCARTGFPEKALKHYAKAIEIRPDYPSAHHNMGGVCQRLLRFEEAISHYQAALRFKPSLVEAMSNLAVAQLNAKKPRDAVDSCRRAIVMQRDAGNGMNLEASHHLNVAMRLLGQKAEAAEETWRALEQLVCAKPTAAADGWARPPPIVVSPGRVPMPACEPPLPALTVVCVKWGAKYGADYVNKLNAMARRALGPGGVAAFICFTEDGGGLDPTVEVRPLAHRDDWEGWWFKAQLFSRSAGLSGRVLYLDLDTVLVGSLAPLRTYEGRFATLSTAGFDAEEGFVDGYNTSVILWDASDAAAQSASNAGGGKSAGGGGAGAGSLTSLHDCLRAEVFECLMRWDHWVEMNVPRCDLLQDMYPGLFVDYRTHCKAQGPPAGSACVCFPRFPKPHEADAAWIREHWVA